MTKQRFLVMGLLVVSSAAILTVTGCNSADVTNKDKGIGTQAKIANNQEDNKNDQEKKKEDYVAENQVLKYAVKSYEESIVTLRWAIGGIITLISILAVAVGYVVVRYSGEYKEAVKEAKEAGKEAGRYAEKAQEKLDSIDEMVERKLKEIEDKGQAQIDKLIKEAEKRRKETLKEAEKQRKISELWAKGIMAAQEGRCEESCSYWQEITLIRPDMYDAWYNWGDAIADQAKKKEGSEADRLFKESYEKYQRAVEIGPDKHSAWNNWGNTLLNQAKKKEGSEADRLFKESYEKYQKAVEVKPDGYEAWYNWGGSLLNQAKKKEGAEKEKLLRESKEKCLKAKNKYTYNLACVEAIEGNEEECKKWLKIGEEARILPTRQYAMADEDLRSYWDKDWFKAIRWEGES